MQAAHSQNIPKRPVKGRFAPSPTGRMHAGNVFASLVAWLVAKSQDGSMVLRIEDLDQTRSRAEFIDQVQRDYELLGLTWDEGPFYQANRDDAYEAAFNSMGERGLVYPCFCSRADLKAASAPHAGEHRVYAGTCRNLSAEQQAARDAQIRSEGRPGPSWRMDAQRAACGFPQAGSYSFVDQVQGSILQNVVVDAGDMVLRRADGSFAYQLAVVVDDAEQGITSVVRGVDLLDSCCQQKLIQQVLGLPEVEYAHVPLLCAPDGKRLAKRDKSAHMDALLLDFKTPEAILGHVATLTGMIDVEEPLTAEDLLAEWKPKLQENPQCLQELWGNTPHFIWQ